MIRRILLSSIVLLISSSAFCIDTTPFYRATLFQGEAKRDTSDWTTHIDFRVAEGSTNQAWNYKDVKTHLFNAYGAFNLEKMAVNLENVDDTKPKTLAFKNAPTTKLGGIADGNGKLAFTGDFHINEYDFTVQQNILHGLYLQAYAPVRHLKIDKIGYAQAITDDADHAKLVNFAKNDLDDILAEYNIESHTCPFNETELCDPLFSLGWHGNCTMENGPVTALRGFLQAGVLIPTGSRKKTERVFSLPFGNNKHWGFNARGNLHATLWEKLVVGANTGVTVFLEQSYHQRLQTSLDQNGWLFLEKGRVTVDQGTLWDVTGYLKTERILGGLSFLAGYSYTQKERTYLKLLDTCILENASDIKNKNEILNANKQLHKWYQHALHAYIQYDFKAHSDSALAPLLEVGYHHSLIGRYTFAADMVSGLLSFAINWKL